MRKNEKMPGLSSAEVRLAYQAFIDHLGEPTVARRAGERFDRWLQSVVDEAYSDGAHDGRRTEVNGL